MRRFQRDMPVRPRPGALGPTVTLRAAHLLGEIHPLQPRPRRRLRPQRRQVELPIRRVGQNGARRPAIPDPQRQRPRIDARQPRHVARLEPGVQRRRRPPIRRIRDVLLHDQPERGHVGRLAILRVGAHVADMREGEGDDLSRIGRVRQRLLIPGHPRVEAKLSDSGARVRPEPHPPEHAAIGQHQHRRRARRHIGRQLFRRGLARQIRQRQPGRCHHRRPMLTWNRPRLSPFTDRFEADSGQPCRRVRTAQAGNDIVDAGHGKTIWEVSSQLKIKMADYW